MVDTTIKVPFVPENQWGTGVYITAVTPANDSKERAVAASALALGVTEEELVAYCFTLTTYEGLGKTIDVPTVQKHYRNMIQAAYHVRQLTKKRKDV